MADVIRALRFLINFLHSNFFLEIPMAGSYVDREMKCVDCGASFTFSAEQQAHFAELGFTNDPKRCLTCRAAKKKASGVVTGKPFERRDAGVGGPPREMHIAVCASCGGEARVPFKPRGDRPVYCSNCFERK